MVLGHNGLLYLRTPSNQIKVYEKNGLVKNTFDINLQSPDENLISSLTFTLDDALYVSGYDATLDRSYIHGMNKEGVELWPAVEVEGAVYSSVSIASGGVVYVSTSKGDIVSIDSLGTAQTIYTADSGIISAPVIDKYGTLYFASLNGTLYSMEPDGNLNWSKPVGGPVIGGVAIGRTETVIVGSVSGTLDVYKKNGELLWEDTLYGEIRGTPAVDSNGNIYVGVESHSRVNTQSNSVRSYSYLGEERWRTTVVKSGEDANGEVLLTDNGVYYTAYDRVISLDSVDGAWDFQTPFGDSGLRSSPIIGSDGTIYYINLNDNTLRAFPSAHLFDETALWPVSQHSQSKSGNQCIFINESFSNDDRDSDLIPDCEEAIHSFNPDNTNDANENSDSDSLTNLEEYLNGTDYFNRDTDFDGVPDDIEVSNSEADPLQNVDLNFNRIPDDYEIVTGLVQEGSVHPNTDSDADGFSDVQEFLARSQDWNNDLSENKHVLWEFEAQGGRNIYPSNFGEDGGVYVNLFNHLSRLTSTGRLQTRFHSTLYPTQSLTIGVDGNFYHGLSLLNDDLSMLTPDIAECGVQTALDPQGNIYCADYVLDENENIVWDRRNLSLSFNDGVAPSVSVRGVTYIGDRTGTVHAIKDNGEHLWQFNANGEIEFPVAIGKTGTIYFGTELGNIYFVDEFGKEEWSGSLGTRISTAPIISENHHIVVGTSDGLIHVLSSEGSPAIAPINLPSGAGYARHIVASQSGDLFISTETMVLVYDSLGVEKWRVEERESSNYIRSISLSLSGELIVIEESSDRKFVTAYSTDSGGPANSPWPMFRHDVYGSGHQCRHATGYYGVTDIDDRDDDGIPDCYEYAYGFDMNISDDAGFDADGDGLTNLQEFELKTGFHILDSDSDGLTDYEEFQAGLNPLSEDTDSDGIPDGEDSNPTGFNAELFMDEDGDGFSARQEFILSTAPDSDLSFPDISPDGALLRSIDIPENIVARPILNDAGITYASFNGGIIKAFHPDGIEKWSYTIAGGATGYISLDEVGRILVSTTDGSIIVLTDNGAEAAEYWVYDTGTAFHHSLTIGGEGMAYIASSDQTAENYIYQLDYVNQVELNQQPIFGSAKSHIVLGVDRELFLATGLPQSLQFDFSIYDLNFEKIWTKRDFVSSEVDEVSFTVAPNNQIYLEHGELIHAISRDGSIVWIESSSTLSSRYNFSSNLLFDGSQLYQMKCGLTAHCILLAFDATTGLESWGIEIRQKWRSLNNVAELALGDGGNIYVNTDRVYSIDKNTGTVNWEYMLPNNDEAFYAPVYAKDAVLSIFGDSGTLYLLANKLISNPDTRRSRPGTDNFNTNNWCIDGSEVISSVLDGEDDLDSDQDGISDCREYVLGMNRLVPDDGNSDDDEDGMINSEELRLGLNHLHPDTDGDGLSDKTELNGTTSPYLFDSDHDGIHDGIEIALSSVGLNPNNPADGLLDLDDDGYSNRQEAWFQTDLNDDTSNPVNGQHVSVPGLGKIRFIAKGHDGEIYVVSGTGSLLAFNQDLSVKWWVTGQFTQKPMVGLDGTIYVMSKVHSKSTLRAFSASGKEKWRYAGESLSGDRLVNAMPALGENGELYVLEYIDNNVRVVVELNSDGQFSREWVGDSVGTKLEINALGHLYFIAEGDIYSIDPEQIDSNNAWRFGGVQWQAQDANPSFFFPDEENGIYYCNFFSGIYRVHPRVLFDDECGASHRIAENSDLLYLADEYLKVFRPSDQSVIFDQPLSGVHSSRSSGLQIHLSTDSTFYLLGAYGVRAYQYNENYDLTELWTQGHFNLGPLSSAYFSILKDGMAFKFDKSSDQNILIANNKKGINPQAPRATVGVDEQNTGNQLLSMLDAPQLELVSPIDGLRVDLGEEIIFQASALDFSESDISENISWYSSKEGLLDQGSSVAASLSQIGTHWISAKVVDSSGAVSIRTIEVSVNSGEQNEAPELTVSSPRINTNTQIGGSINLSAQAIDAEDGFISDSIVWHSNVTGRFAQGVGNVAHSLPEGIHQVTAKITDSHGNTVISDAVPISVTDYVNTNPTISIVSAPGSAYFGDELLFQAGVSDAQDDLADLNENIRWYSSIDGFFGEGNELRTSSLSEGAHLITAKVVDSALGESQDITNIQIVDVGAVQIASPINGSVFSEGDNIHFAILDDTDNWSVTGWDSTLDGEFSRAAETGIADLSVGIHSITARVRQGSVNITTPSIQIEVEPFAEGEILWSQGFSLDTNGLTTLSEDFDHEFGVLEISSVRGTEQNQVYSADNYPINGDLNFTGQFIVERQGQESSVDLGVANSERIGNLQRFHFVRVVGEQLFVYFNDLNGDEQFEHLGNIEEDRPYQVDIAFHSTGSTLYVYAVGQSRADGFRHDASYTDWNSAGFYLGANQEDATRGIVVDIDNLVVFSEGGRNNPPFAVFSGIEEGEEFNFGNIVNLRATAYDIEDDDLNLTSEIKWFIDGQLHDQVGGIIALSDLTIGAHAVALNVTDSTGDTWVSNPITIYIVEPEEYGTTVWSQSFVLNANGLTDLHDQLTVDGGVLRSVRSSHWDQTSQDVFGERVYTFDDAITFKAQLLAESWETSGELGFGAKNTTLVREDRRFHTAFMENGRWWTRANNPYGESLVEELGAAELNVVYQVEVVFHSSGSTLYIYPLGGSRGDLFVHESTYTDWQDVRLYLYTNQLGLAGYFDNLRELSPEPVGNQAPNVVVESPTSGDTFIEGTEVRLVAFATDLEDDDLALSNSIQWLVNNEVRAEVGTHVVVTGLAPGYHSIVARVTDSDGESVSSDPINIFVIDANNNFPTIEISEPSPGQAFIEREVIRLSALVSDIEDDDVELSDLVEWLIDGEVRAERGASVVLNDLDIGAHSVVARVTDSAGATTNSEAVSINITAPNIGSGAEWTQYFDTGSSGLTALHPNMQVGDGVLATTRMTGWQTAMFSVFGERTYSFLDRPIFKAQVLVSEWETTGEIGFGASNSAEAVEDKRFHTAYLENGRWEFRGNNSYGYAFTEELGPAELNTVYQLELELHAGGSSLYIYPLGGSRGDLYEHHQSYTDWNDARLYFYTNQLGLTGQIDGLEEITTSGPTNTAPSVNILSPAGGARFTRGESIAISATASDAEDDDAVITAAITWMVDGELRPETGENIFINDLLDGSYLLTASVVDSDGTKVFSPGVRFFIDAGVNNPPSINITAPTDGSMFSLGDSVNLVASVSDAEDDDSVLSSAIEWLINNTLRAETGSNIDVSDLSIGSHNIVARVTDTAGETSTSSTITITINPVANNIPVVSVSAPLDGANYSEGDTINFVASASDVEDDDTVLSSTIEWWINDVQRIETGSSIQVSDLIPGSYNVVARVTDTAGGTGESSALSITVSELANNSPTVIISSPEDGSTYTVGESINFVAVANDVEDDDQSLSANIEWVLNGTTLAETGASIELNDLAADTYTVVARVTDTGGITGTSSAIVITVSEAINNAPTVTISSPLDDSSFTEGDTINFVASASDVEDYNVSLSNTIQWRINGSVRTEVGASINVNDLLPGSYTIVAEVTDSGGEYGVSAEIAITIVNNVNAIPLVSITSPLDGASYAVGESIPFIASANDVEDDDSVLSNNIEWLVDGSVRAETGSSFNVSDLLPGAHTLVARVTDSAGDTGSSSVINISITSDGGEPGGIVWMQDFSSDASGLSALPDHLNVEGGRLKATRMTGWQTTTFDVDGERVYAFDDEVILKAQVRVEEWQSSGEIGFGADNGATDRANMRFHTAFLENGRWYARINNVYGYGAVEDIGPAELNVDYQVEVVFHSSGSSLYIYPVGQARGDLYVHEHSFIDWGEIRTYLYTNQLGLNAYIDNLQEILPGGAVNTPPSVNINSPIDGTSFEIGENISLNATAVDSEDDNLVLSNSIEWLINSSAIAERGSSVSISDLSAGNHTVVARVTDSGGLSASSATINITVNAPINNPPSIEITLPASGSVYEVGETINLSAQASDVEDDDSVLSVSIQWLFNDVLRSETGASISVNDLSQGSYDVNAQVSDSAGVPALSSPITLTVNPPVNTPPSVSIIIPAEGSVYNEGESVSVRASASDAEDDDAIISANIEWLINDVIQSEQGAEVTFNDLQAGAHAIVARVTDSDGSEGESAAVNIVVNAAANNPPSILLTSPVDGSVYNEGETIQLTATASDTEDDDLSLTASIEWLLDGALYNQTGGDIQISHLSVGNHTIVARVTDSNGASDSSDQVSVVVNSNGGGGASWSQDFSTNSAGLSSLPDNFSVGNGRLNVSRMGGWQTARLNIFGERIYTFENGLVFKGQFSASSWQSSGEIGIGVINTTAVRADMRAHTVFLENGQLHIRSNNVYGYDGVHALGPATLNTLYQVEIEFTNSGSTLYVYPAGQTRNDGYVDIHSYDDWGDVILNLYSNQLGLDGYIDNLEESEPTP